MHLRALNGDGAQDITTVGRTANVLIIGTSTYSRE